MRPGQPRPDAGGRSNLPSRPVPRLTDRSIAVIGLGAMGAGMAARLAETGADLRVFNRNPAKAAEFAGRPNVTVAATPAAAAKGTELVLVSVADDEALRQVLDGPDGVLAGAPELVVNATTVAPSTVRVLGERIPLLDAGVLGNADHARSGQLRWYVGGTAESLRRATPVFDALGRQVLHVGPQGTGMVLKISMNLLMGIEMQALGEVVALATGAGLDRRLVLDTVAESGFAAPVMRFKAVRMADRSYERPDFRLRLMAKDLDLAMAQMTAAGLSLPMTEAATGSHRVAAAGRFADQDCAAIVELFAAEAAR